jgi:phosphohistidine phosphatase
MGFGKKPSFPSHSEPQGAPLKTIFLLRHAKSSWDEPNLDDYERPLAPRGIKAAPRIGKFMARQGWIPERVLCSGARRARETWEMVSDVLEGHQPVEYLPEIYHGSSLTVKEMIRRLPDEENSVLVVGHNPTFHHLALTLAGSGEDRALRQLQFKYPTGALAILDFQVDSWSRIRDGRGFLRDFIRPKALKKNRVS